MSFSTVFLPYDCGGAPFRDLLGTLAPLHQPVNALELSVDGLLGEKSSSERLRTILQVEECDRGRVIHDRPGDCLWI